MIYSIFMNLDDEFDNIAIDIAYCTNATRIIIYYNKRQEITFVKKKVVGT